MKRMTEATMNRDEVLSLLRAHKATLAQRFGVVELRLYGSFARNQAAGDSDVDVLVRFDASARLETVFRSSSLSGRSAGATGGYGDQPGA